MLNLFKPYSQVTIHQSICPHWLRISNALFIVALIFSLTPATLYAEEKKLTKVASLSHKVFKKLELAQKLVEEGKPNEAHLHLDLIIEDPARNHYEKSMAQRVKAYIYYQSEKYELAIIAYEAVVDKPGIPEALQLESLNSLAQLNFIVGNYKTSIAYFKRWFATAKDHSPRSFATFSQAYFQIGEYEAAVKPMLTAIKKINATGKRAQENWYLILRACYYELDKLDRVGDILEKLVLYYPKRKYWIQLAGIYGQLNQPKKQLSTMEIAYRQGYLTEEKDLLNLTYLYLSQDIPYKAAKVLDQAIKKNIVPSTDKNLHLLSTAWSAAQESEKALPELIKAASKSKKGQLDTELARLYFNMEDWQQTAVSIESAYAKGKFRNKPDIDMLYGMSLYHQDKLVEALDVFTETEPTQADTTIVLQWMGHIEKELVRRQALQQQATTPPEEEN